MRIRWNFRIVLMIAAIAWIGAVGTGMALLQKFETTPGQVAKSPTRWPTLSKIQRDPERATLVMLVHSRCPCTRASLDELAEVMSHSQGLLAARVLFFTPSSPSAAWVKTSLWRQAKAIPGVQVIADPGGAEAALFGAQTSGEVFVYDPSGKRLFRGGITSGRGTAGESLGRGAILSLLNIGSADRNETPAFGCPIFDRSASPARGATSCNP
jgi:hypothetical protein